jgi:hypothetical protein
VLVAALPAAWRGSADILYVWRASPTPLAPYATWATAAHAIQPAVDAAAAGDLILVTNDYYNAFGGEAWGSNVVVLAKAVTLESVGGSARISGVNNLRAVYMTNGAVLSGFRLQFGSIAYPGAGVFCDHGGLVTNCSIVNNHTSDDGGGAFLYYGGTLVDCSIMDNVAESGGGVFCYVGGELRRCRIEYNKAAGNAARAGGVYCYLGGRLDQCSIAYNDSFGTAGGVYSFLGDGIEQCRIVRNDADENAGGVYCHYPGIIRNCVIISNTADGTGGGVYCSFRGTVQHCTIAANTALNGGGIWCSDSTVQNCILWHNSSTNGFANGSRNQHNCIEGWTGSGMHVITQDPRFVAGDLRLAADSPCRDSGTNLDYVYSSMDFDGLPRFMGSATDRGAFEFFAPTPPLITSAVFAIGARAVPFTYRIAAHFSPTNFGADGLPAGLALDATNGVIAGVPVNTGLYTLSVFAANAGGVATGQLWLCIASTNLAGAPRLTENIKSLATRARGDDGLGYGTTRRAQSKCTLRVPCDLPMDFSALPCEPLMLACGDLHLTLCFTNFTGKSGSVRYAHTVVRDGRALVTALRLKKTARMLMLAFTSKNPDDMLLGAKYLGMTTNITTQLGATLLLGTRAYIAGAAPCAVRAEVKQKKIGRGENATLLDLPRVTVKSARRTVP